MTRTRADATNLGRATSSIAGSHSADSTAPVASVNAFHAEVLPVCSPDKARQNASQCQSNRPSLFRHSATAAILTVVLSGVVCLPGCNSGSEKNGEKEPQGSEQTTNDNRSPFASLTKEDFLRAIRLRNRSLGHLENMEWQDTEATLTELVELAPDLVLARRNLAIGRVLAVIARNSPYPPSGPKEDMRRYRRAVDDAKQAVGDYRKTAKADYDRALADLLMGKLLVHSDGVAGRGIDEGLKYLRQAAESVPSAPDFRFAVAMAMDGHRDYTHPDNPEAADLLRELQASAELAPDNLFVLQKLLIRQALCLRSKNAATRQLALSITGTLKRISELLQPLNESILKQRRVNLIDTINEALKNFDPSHPESLMGPAMMTGNLIAPEIATLIDQRRIDRFILEYVQTEFDEPFQQAARRANAIEDDGPSVMTEFVATDGLPDVSDVTDVDLMDMNLDGRDDLVMARAGTVEVWAQPEADGAWQLLMKTAATDIPLHRFVLADIDRDFDRAVSDFANPVLLRDADGDHRIVLGSNGERRWFDTDHDLIAWSSEGVRIFRNELVDGKRVLTEVPGHPAVNGINDVAVADLEADGDLDLAIATTAGIELWRNTDGTTFVSMQNTVDGPKHAIAALAMADWNRDIAIDVVAVAADGRAGILQNVFHGRFRWKPFERQIPLAEGADRLTEVAVVGPNQHGRFELWCAGAGDGPQAVTDSQAVTTGARTATAVRRLFADFDNDGKHDVLNLGGAARPLSFSVNGVALPKDLHAVAGAVADLDDDGDLDVVLANAEGRLQQLRNEGGHQNNWIEIVPRGKPDDPQFPSQRVNMHAVGAVVELRAGSLYHGQIVTRPRLHLGLGKRSAADTLRVIWTDGVPQHVTDIRLLNARAAVLAPQILSGSCPYIYTWNGERFQFFSDCLWAAPLGLMQANGEFAPTRSWEHLLIPGTALKEKDGFYVLQLTEELHEIAYFDHVELTAVDHPADVRIFTNEKVGPPQIAEHRIHTVRRAVPPKSVVDGRGTDLLPGLRRADGDYVQAFQKRIMQGLTDEWVMEFDVGDISNKGEQLPVRLFLTGWVFPTDTCLNEAIRQNPDLSPPQPPVIEIPTPDGSWQVVKPFIGFPSGKTKAMVVDISDACRDGQTRFRLRSTMELYWDEAFLTFGETDAATVVQNCMLESADLHFRGFSRRRYADNSLFRHGRGPEDYDYDSVRTHPMWPAIAGRFTKYGPTTPLLTEHDDRLVVMGPGDELTLRFRVPEQGVPQGWKRDFVLRNVGYDKDANLNTAYGQSSEPYPFRAMTRYPFSDADEIPQTPEYRQYREEWQTREYTEAPFWNVIRHRTSEKTRP